MNPQFHLLWSYPFAQAASDFVRHGSPTRPPLAATLPRYAGRDCTEPLPCRCIVEKAIDPAGHDEIVLVQPLYFFRPQRDGG